MLRFISTPHTANLISVDTMNSIHAMRCEDLMNKLLKCSNVHRIQAVAAITKAES